MVLYGAPLQALGAAVGQEDREFDAAPPDPPSSKDDADRDDTAREDTTQGAEAAEAFETAVSAKDHLEGIPLYPGYNLLSLPEEPPDPDPAAVFAPIDGSYVEVFAHDVCDTTDEDGWQRYVPTDPAASDLLDVDPTMGLWIEATAPAVLPSDGTLPATTSWQLCTGWNLIGFPAAQPRPVRSALQSIDGKYVRIFGYDASDADDPWEIWDANVPDWANDLRELRPGFGYWLLVTEDVTLEIANEGEPPEVAFTAPADLAEVTAPTEIRGTVESQLLESWSLAYRFAGETEWSELATGNVPVADGPLATLDPTLLLNGLYELRLRAVDFAGAVVEETTAVVVDGQMKIGHFTLSFVDLAIPLSGLDVEIVRTYDSRQRQMEGDFGHGWTLDVRQGSYRNNRPPGDGWQLTESFLPCDTVQETKSHLTTVRLSDQEVYRFALRLVDGAPTTGGCFARAVFEYVDGPLPGTTLEIFGSDEVFYANGSDVAVDPDTQEPFVPEEVKLTTRDGRIFELDLAAGVTRVEDLNGNRIDITSEGVIHSSGVGIDFERDAEGRITRITDPRGAEIVYGYTAAGDLETVTDRASNTTRFSYSSELVHLLEDVEDPRGVQPIRNDYDEDGRLIRHTDAFGKTIELDHDLDARQEVITDRLGHSTVLEYDERGNVVREVDEVGGVTERTFDAEDNLLTEKDPLGRVTTYTYSPSNDLLTLTDPLEQTTAYSYNDRGQILTVTDPKENVTTSTYDAAGNLLTTTDALNQTTAFTYNAAGDLLTTTDPLDHTTHYSYNARGDQLTETDPLDNVTTSTYDANGNRLTESRTRTLADGTTETLVTSFTYDALDRVTETTAPDGSTTRTAYDPLGKVKSRTDALGRVTTMAYDLMGRLATTTYPDETTTERSYDAEGRVLTRTDRGGRITRFTYDDAGRLLTTTHPDDATESQSYDLAGQLVSTTDARGNTTVYAYDAAGRRVGVTDALDQTTTFAFDANGNQAAVTDALGHTTEFAYDALGRLVTTTHPDETTTEVAYDALGRRTTEVDAAGVHTEFAYDALGRLVEVTDALDGTTLYSYDEQGNRISQADANGHTTRFGHDALGRPTSRTLPDGATETTVYDAAGNRIRHTDFNGATVTYDHDAAGRLTRRGYPDGTAVTFTYTPTGRRATVTDARGVTRYAYDDRDRLVSITAPEGWTLRYSWDEAGNRTALTAELGEEGSHATAYAYDAAGRLTTVTDPRGGVYTHGYDAVGRRTSLSYPNGVETTYAHDAVGRLLGLHTEGPDGTVIQNYAYTLGPTGQRQSVIEHDGTVRSWEYDALYRLTRERVTDGEGALVYENAFTYDPVGNRTEQICTGADGASETIVYAYDVRDRLLSERVAEDPVTSYGWDANGNLVSKVESGLTTTYGWDAENRLRVVTLADGSEVSHGYDADGVWVARTIQHSGESAETTVLVTDTAGALSQIVAELEEGVLAVQYPRSDRLLALLRSGADRYAHADGVGSTRALTGDGAEPTDRYVYEAFGASVEHAGETENPYRFAGEYFNPLTALAFHRARWLDPHVGRFLGLDPLLQIRRHPYPLQPYQYADSDPVGRSDSTGLFSAAEASLAATIAVEISSIQASIFLEALRASKFGKDPEVRQLLSAIDAIQTAAGVTFVVGSVFQLARFTGGRLRSRSFEFLKKGSDARVATSGARAVGTGEYLDLLSAVRSSGGRVRVQRGDIVPKDLAALTRSTGNEFALYRNRGTGSLYLAELGPVGGAVPTGSRLIMHSHPGKGPLALRPSPQDRAALELLGQRSSLIVDESGTFVIRFGRENLLDNPIRPLGN